MYLFKLASSIVVFRDERGHCESSLLIILNVLRKLKVPMHVISLS